MIKKLDKLILRAFIGPFVATFFITLFVLVLQFFWKYIDDLVGKGLDLGTIGYLTGIVAVTWIPLAVPLAILISSIMTFGNLGESYELVAIKSAGIPLLRFMRPLFVVALLLCGVSFLIQNYVTPAANLKFSRMLYDITYSQPSFDIKEGVFYDKMDGYAIKIGKKDADKTGIHDVIIYEYKYSLQDVFVIANHGRMEISPDRKFLEFHLQDGWRYEERGPAFGTNTEYIRLGFKEYKKVFDLSKFQLMQTNDSAFMNNYRMKNVNQLKRDIDSLQRVAELNIRTRMQSELYSYFMFNNWTDSVWSLPAAKDLPSAKPGQTYASLLPDSMRRIAQARMFDRFSLIKNSSEVITQDYESRQKDKRMHQIEWFRKYSLSLACLVLFLIGAPLGSIIRKGGLGMPLVFAVIFFMVFHLLNMFGEKFVKQQILIPSFGMWMSTMILVPIGIFLTYKAMHDSQLFNKEFYYRAFKRFRLMISSLRGRTSAAETA